MPNLDHNPSPRTWIRWARRGLLLLLRACSILAWIWCIGFAYTLDDNLPHWFSISLATGIAIGIPGLYVWFRSRPSVPRFVLLGVLIASVTGYVAMQPRHDREWGTAQSRMPTFQVETNEQNQTHVSIQNIRSTRYGPAPTSALTYYDDVYELSKLKAIWFGVDRFTELQPLAHTFLSFEFEPSHARTNFLAFSVETRREQDEKTFSPFRGMFHNYELIYVVADEQDVLSVRADVQQHPVQLYPIRATQIQAQAMFLSMLERANALQKNPEFYHTLTNNCTNNIVAHTNQIVQTPINSWQRGVVFPGYSDWLAYRLRILDTNLPLDEAREEFRIDQRVREYDGRGNFSEFIRKR